MELGEWLRNLGLERYEAPFRDQAIDMDVLADLTEHDLSLLGVALGDRKRLQKAIANLALHSLPHLTAPAPRPARDEAERRLVAVMFCDLVGSTELAARLDAEDWRDLRRRLSRRSRSKAVTEIGGHVAEEARRRASWRCSAIPWRRRTTPSAPRAPALAIQRALAELNAATTRRGMPALVARIGIETGPVVVDSAGEVYGDAPTSPRACRARPSPEQLLVTRRRAAADRRPVRRRGQGRASSSRACRSRPTLFRIVRASGGGRRLGQRKLTPLVGREEEMAMLMRRWERARGGEGQLVLIVGEPGIGKSRLIEEFHDRLGDTPHTWVEWASSQLLQNTPLHPIAEWGAAALRRRGRSRREAAGRAGERRSRSVRARPGGKRCRCWRRIARHSSRCRKPRAKLAPEELRRRQMAAMVAWIVAGARAQPMVLAFEDLHWADPTTLEVLAAPRRARRAGAAARHRDGAAGISRRPGRRARNMAVIARAARSRPDRDDGRRTIAAPRAAA